jgi:hypothetical protein
LLIIFGNSSNAEKQKANRSLEFATPGFTTGLRHLQQNAGGLKPLQPKSGLKPLPSFGPTNFQSVMKNVAKPSNKNNNSQNTTQTGPNSDSNNENRVNNGLTSFRHKTNLNVNINTTNNPNNYNNAKKKTSSVIVVDDD